MRNRKRDQIAAAAQTIREAIADLLDLDAVFMTKHAVVLRGRSRIPHTMLETAVNERLRVHGYEGSVDLSEAEPDRLGAVLITVRLSPLTKLDGIPWINIVLFALTVLTTVFVDPQFSLWFLTILLFHEFGHFFLARRWNIDVSLPYFLPFPSILGTLGAVIQLRSPIRDRIALFDMAIAGPLAGFAVALVALIVGLAQSTAIPSGPIGEGIYLGESLLFKALSDLLVPGLTPDMDVVLHPIAYAGWAGLLVTTFNLFPIGQLDGGHIAYALFGRRQRYLAYATIAALAISMFWYTWWAIWIALAFIVKPEHPPTLLDEIALGPRRRLLGWLAILIFILCFSPIPIRLEVPAIP